MRGYAYNTSVPVENSRNEIEYTLTKYGATAFAFGTDENRSIITFKVQNRVVRITLPKAKGARATEKQLAKENRRRWRSLLLVVKSKLEGIASGITTFDNEFLPYIVTSTGQTVGEWAAPQLDKIVAGEIPLLLGDGK